MNKFFGTTGFTLLAATFLLVAGIQGVYLVHSMGNNDRTHISFKSDPQKACRIADYATLEHEIITYFKTYNRQQQVTVPIIAFTTDRISVVISATNIDKKTIDFLRVTIADALTDMEDKQKPCYSPKQMAIIQTDDHQAPLVYLSHVTVHDGVGIIGWLSMLFNAAIAVFIYRIRPSHGNAA